MLLQLHDDFGLSQGPTLDVWPPIKWQEFRPNSREEILDHYYAYSTGCKTPTLFGGLALAAGAAAAAAFGPALLAGAKTALLGIKAKAITGGSAIIGTKAVDQMSDQVSKTAKEKAQKAGNTAKQKNRRRFDNRAEKDRIVDTYIRQYNKTDTGGFQSNVGSMTLDQLKARVSAAKNSVKVAEGKCKKLPCDTAGCRNMGALNAIVQYCEALIEAYKASGTTTPQEFNEKFSKAAADGKTRIGSALSGITLPALVIAGLILSKIKK